MEFLWTNCPSRQNHTKHKYRRPIGVLLVSIYDVNIPEPPGLNAFVKGLAAIKNDKEYIENAQVLAILAREVEEESDDDSAEETDGEEEESEQAWNERDNDDTAFEETSPEV